jgi:hypothetical protein
MMSAEGECVLSNLPGVHNNLAAMGLLWALEKGYYVRLVCDTYVSVGVYWRISCPLAVE